LQQATGIETLEGTYNVVLSLLIIWKCHWQYKVLHMHLNWVGNRYSIISFLQVFYKWWHQESLHFNYQLKGWLPFFMGSRNILQFYFIFTASFRIRQQISEPYEKIRTRTAQLRRLQVF
jgi:hypothetical protein